MTARHQQAKGKLCVKRLNDVMVGGGSIPAIVLNMVKVFPRQHLEKVEGSTAAPAILSDAEEEARRQDFEKRRLNAMEKVSDQIQQEVEADVDEMAPEAWRALTKSLCPEEFYEGLSGDGRAEVDSWREKRGAILRDRIQKEVEAELEVDDTLSKRESIPFVRALVTTKHGSPRSNGKMVTDRQALLTIWNPTEDHMEKFEEGKSVLVLNLSVRNSKYDGMLQLTANNRTRMESVGDQQNRLGQLSSAPSAYQSLLRVHVASRKLLGNVRNHHSRNDTTGQRTNLRRLPSSFRGPKEVDIIGVVFEIRDNNVYVTDESKLGVRIQFEENQQLLRINLGDTIAFSDVTLGPFDVHGDCAMASYSSSSSFSRRPISSSSSSCATSTPTAATGGQRSLTLSRWSVSPNGQSCLEHMQSFLRSKIRIRASIDQVTAVGYLSGLRFDAGCAGASQLHVEVECGPNGVIHQWELPLCLLEEMRSACLLSQQQQENIAHNPEEAVGGREQGTQSATNSSDRMNGDESRNDRSLLSSSSRPSTTEEAWTRLNADEEETAEQLGMLEPIFRQRGLLWRFQLRPSNGRGYAVESVEVAEVESLSRSLMCIHRQQQQQQQQQKWV